MNDTLRKRARADVMDQENPINLEDKIESFYQKYGQYTVHSYLMNAASKNEFGIQLSTTDIADYESIFGNSNLFQHNILDYLLLNQHSASSSSELLYGRGPLNDKISSKNRSHNTIKGGL